MKTQRSLVPYSRALWGAGTVWLLLLAFIPRVWNVAYGDLSFDEIATVFIAQRSLREVLLYVADAVREHPPLYYLLMSLWFRLTGASEFVARYPSALIGVLSVAVSFRFGRRLLRRGRSQQVAFEAGAWSALLLAVMPFSVWAGRTARMYALVILLALAIMHSWFRWSQRPSFQGWLLFAGVSLAGMFTHYYLLFLWGVQGCILLFFPRRTRGIRRAWLATVGAGIAALLLGITFAPGIRNTVMETGSRFPALPLRWGELQTALMELLLNRSHPDLWLATAIGLLLAGAGWLLIWRGSRSTALWLMLWALLPLAAVLLIPEAIHGRYVIVVLPALAIGFAGLITLVRPYWLRWLFLVILLVQAGVRWNEGLLAPRDNGFSQQIAHLRGLAEPGDALVLNNPWIQLLLTYYTPPQGIEIHTIPGYAPPGFNTGEDLPRLEQVAAEYERLWVAYDAVNYSDPKFQLSRWLAESWYNVHEFGNLALYLPGSATLTTVSEGVVFGPDLELKRAGIDQNQVAPGQFIRVHLEWEGTALSWKTQLTLGLLGQDGRIWTEHEFKLGPVRQDEFSTLPDRWIERRGLWVRPGVPPGVYQLVLKGVSTDRVISLPPGATVEGWTPLAEVKVSGLDSTPAPEAALLGSETAYLPLILNQARLLPGDPEGLLPAISIPQWAEAQATFGGRLALVGLDPASDWIGQGYPLEFSLYWKALTPLPAATVQVRLVGPDTWFTGGDALQPTAFALGPGFYPASSWEPGIVVEQAIQLPLPRNLPVGDYHVQVRLEDDAGTPWEVAGTRQALLFEEYLHGREQSLAGEWADVFTVAIRTRQRASHPPLFSRRVSLDFGDVLRLRAYRLSATQLRAGESAELTLYWQARQEPTQVYAAFNHLLNAEGIPIWTHDSWPQGGVYTTDRWIQGEVVAETAILHIPEGTPPGEVTLYVGIYDPATVVRLPAKDRDGQPIVNDAAPLLTVQVIP